MGVVCMCVGVFFGGVLASPTLFSSFSPPHIHYPSFSPTRTYTTSTTNSVTVPLVAPGEASQYIGCWQLEGTDPEKGERLTLGNRCVRFGLLLLGMVGNGGCTWGYLMNLSVYVVRWVVVGGGIVHSPSPLSVLTSSHTQQHETQNSIWVDIQVVDGSEGDAEGGFGGGSEWEVVTAPTEEEEGQEEESAAAAAEGAVSTPSDGASVVVVGEQAAAEAASVEGEGEEDETWKRWEKELACLSEMGFETRLDACVAALERVRPTDAAVSFCPSKVG